MIDVSAVAVVDGTTDVIGPPGHGPDERHERAVLLQLLPAESVEDQEQHLRRVEGDRGEPRRDAVATRPQQRRDDVREARTGVVGQQRSFSHGVRHRGP